MQQTLFPTFGFFFGIHCLALEMNGAKGEICHGNQHRWLGNDGVWRKVWEVAEILEKDIQWACSTCGHQCFDWIQ